MVLAHLEKLGRCAKALLLQELQGPAHDLGELHGCCIGVRFLGGFCGSVHSGGVAVGVSPRIQASSSEVHPEVVHRSATDFHIGCVHLAPEIGRPSRAQKLERLRRSVSTYDDGYMVM